MRAFKKTVQARIRQDRKYREELLREGVECLLAGDLDAGKDRDHAEGQPDDDDPEAGLAMSGSPAYGSSIPCMASQLTKALNQPVLVVSLGYMPKP